MVEPHFRFCENFNAPTDDFTFCDPFSDIREVELLEFWGQPARRTVEASCLYERSTRGDAAMESCKKHERGMMRARSSRPPRILQLKATRKMGVYSPKPLPNTNKQRLPLTSTVKVGSSCPLSPTLTRQSVRQVTSIPTFQLVCVSTILWDTVACGTKVSQPP